MTKEELNAWTREVRDRLGLSKFNVYFNFNGSDLYLADIGVPRSAQGQGLGSKAMKELTNLADSIDARVLLTPAKRDPRYGTTSRTRLVKFYKGFGFVMNKGRNKDFTTRELMYRNPKGTKTGLKEFLQISRTIIEAPINDYETIGDFNKAYSYRSKRDRLVVTHPKSIERTKKKFANTDFVFNFYFVNTREAMGHREIGVVEPEWVRENLGEAVYNAILKNAGEDQITVIFTGNAAEEKVAPTAWILAHRIGHALNASSNRNAKGNAGYYYKEAHDHLIREFSSMIRDYYGAREMANTTDKMTARWQRESVRVDQLIMTNFFQSVCTFKSARDKNIRDWFEVINELIAQRLTTGHIKFNPAPRRITGKNALSLRGDADELNEQLEMLARDMEYNIDSMFGAIIGDIFVM